MNKYVALFFFLSPFLFSPQAITQSWRFFGPDSAIWRGIVNLDAVFHPGQSPRIGVGTGHGVAVNHNREWSYILRDRDLPFGERMMFRHVSYTPWSDSVVFAGVVQTVSSEFCVNFGRYRFSISWLQEMGPQHCVCLGNWDFAYPGNDSGWVFASYCAYFMKSSDNGGNWEWDFFEDYYTLFLTTNLRGSSGLYLGGRPHLHDTVGTYVSSDRGMNWRLLSPFVSWYTKAQFFASGDTLVLAASKLPYSTDSTCGIFWSSNHGTTWTQVLSNINIYALDASGLQVETLYAASSGGVYRSTTTGLSWQLYHNALPSLRIVDLAKDPYSDTLYVATADSGVYQVFDHAVGVGESPLPPSSFSLHHNYPNPYNPETNIEFTLPRAVFVSLKVYDLLGRELRTLVNEFRSAGSYSVTFDGRNQPSGIYLYRLTAGTFAQTRKMVLLK